MAQKVDQYEDVTEIPPPTIDLTADVIASGLTREELAAIEDAVGVQPRAHSEIGLKMIGVAEGQLGVRESGGANNGVPLTRYVRRFWPNSGPQPWCAFFASWCYLEVTGQRPPWTNPVLVDSVRAWASANGKLVRTPLRGDLFGVGGQHMGLVARSLSDELITIEGNHSDAVTAVHRPLGQFWYARP